MSPWDDITKVHIKNIQLQKKKTNGSNKNKRHTMHTHKRILYTNTHRPSKKKGKSCIYVVKNLLQFIYQLLLIRYNTITAFVQILKKSGKFWNLLWKFSRSWKALKMIIEKCGRILENCDADLENEDVCYTGNYRCIHEANQNKFEVQKFGSLVFRRIHWRTVRWPSGRPGASFPESVHAINIKMPWEVWKKK